MTWANDSPRPVPALRTVIRSAGIVGLGLIGVAVGLSDVLARAPANATDIAPVLLQPSALYPFGTDILGRDMASETLHALAVTATASAFGAVVAIVGGGLPGFLAARLPWGLAPFLRWIAGSLGAVPALLLAILFIGITERSLAPLAAGLAAAPLAFARAYDRARVIDRSRYAEFARATGISRMSLLRRDLAYEVRDTLLADAARALAAVAIILSTASFLGFGAVPPHRDLGLMIGAARDTYFDAWWTAAFPALVLAFLIFCARLAAALEEVERP
jgi:peptide/nickel transport system permease protein